MKSQKLLSYTRRAITDYDMIKKEDKARASYYNYYTSKRWGEMKGYDICINTSKYGIDKTIDLLYDIVNNY